LDIDLPGQSGIDILTEIRATTAGETIPVIMYSNTSAPETIQTCYREGANAYVVKPRDYDEIVVAIDQLLSFWAETADIPLPA
jgi:DNA-binding response OmpR family regulator